MSSNIDDWVRYVSQTDVGTNAYTIREVARIRPDITKLEAKQIIEDLSKLEDAPLVS